MRKNKLLILIAAVLMCGSAIGQSIHFSQYFNAPLLLNPANTALVADYDYRVGMNYRNQWATLPVPYNTFSAFGDFKLGGNKNNENHNNWLGVGVAFFGDKAGDGNLALNQFQGSLAYHLQLSSYTMLSLGVSASYVQRSVNFDNLTFDAQWDGVKFNPNMTNGEKVGVIKTSFYTVNPGLNFAWFPHESLYAKLGVAVGNVNRPVESFYKSTTNVIGYRPMVHLDILWQTSPVLLVNPSAYYSTQTGASELLLGSQFRTMLSDKNEMLMQLILGAYTRLGDAIIGLAGMQVGPVQFTANYDFTISKLTPYNNSYGALEFSIIYSNLYHPDQGIKKVFGCPRFF